MTFRPLTLPAILPRLRLRHEVAKFYLNDSGRIPARANISEFQDQNVAGHTLVSNWLIELDHCGWRLVLPRSESGDCPCHVRRTRKPFGFKAVPSAQLNGVTHPEAVQLLHFASMKYRLNARNQETHEPSAMAKFGSEAVVAADRAPDNRYWGGKRNGRLPMIVPPKRAFASQYDFGAMNGQ